MSRIPDQTSYDRAGWPTLVPYDPRNPPFSQSARKGWGSLGCRDPYFALKKGGDSPAPPTSTLNFAKNGKFRMDHPSMFLGTTPG